MPNISDLHGFVIKEEEERNSFIVFSQWRTLKLDLDGKTILKIPASSIPNKFKRNGKDGKTLVRLTGADVSANGDIFLADGYSSDFIHRFNKKGKYLIFVWWKGCTVWFPYSSQTGH